MKDYEKAAIAIGAAALGIAGYQAYKTKQAADAIEATDPAKNPVDTAVDLAQNTIGGVTSWFTQRLDNSTGYVKGKSEEVVNWLSVIPETGLYVIGKAKDYALDATEAGTKYVWGIGANVAKVGKDVKTRLTNNPFTLMGSIPEHIYVASRKVPTMFTTLGNALTGANSGKEATTKKKGGTAAIKHFLGYIAPPFNDSKLVNKGYNTRPYAHPIFGNVKR